MYKVIILFILSFSLSVFANCEEPFLFNNKPRVFINQFDSAVPGEFNKVENITNDGFFFFDGYRRIDNDKTLGEILYKYYDQTETLFISDLHVKVKNQKIGSMLLAKVLSDYPYVTKVKTVLGLDNFNAFMLAKENGLSDIKALKRTPAYKMRKKMGFKKIDKESIDIDLEGSSIIFMVERY